jgi:hypothetical protein
MSTEAGSSPNACAPSLQVDSAWALGATQARAMLAQGAVGIARIAKNMGLTRQTVYRIKDDPASPEAAFVAWERR